MNERLRAAAPGLIADLTTGPGGRFVPSEAEPRVAGPGTGLLPPAERVAHVAALRPDICTLDLHTIWSGTAAVIHTPADVRAMARVIREAGGLPEFELFESGDIALPGDLLVDGTLAGPPLTSIVCGARHGFQSSLETALDARDLSPEGAAFTAVGIGRHAFTAAAQSFQAGSRVRVGLEDATTLSRGVPAPSNAAMVLGARRIVEDLGGAIATPAEPAPCPACARCGVSAAAAARGGRATLPVSAPGAFPAVRPRQVTTSNGAETVTPGALGPVRFAPGDARGVSDRAGEEVLVPPATAERESPSP